MSQTSYTPGPTPNSVRTADGTVLTIPVGWVLLPPGDAALTRRVKAAGDHWVVAERKGRKVFSKGIWAASATIGQVRAELEAERSTDGYAKKQEAAARRREKAQAEDEVARRVYAWNERKRRFSPRQIALAQDVLARKSWIAAA